MRHVPHQDASRSRRTSATHSPATSSHASPRTQAKTSLTSLSQTAIHPLQQHRREAESVVGTSLLDSSVVEGLVRKWEDVIGLRYEVKVRNVAYHYMVKILSVLLFTHLFKVRCITSSYFSIIHSASKYIVSCIFNNKLKLTEITYVAMVGQICITK